MRRPYYRKPGVSSQGGYRDAVGSMDELRKQILDIILIGTAVLGLAVLVATLIPNIQQKNWGVVIVTVSTYLWIIWLAVNRKLAYKLRAIGFTVIPYVLGISAQITDGMTGNSRIWLIGFTALTAVILGFRAGVFALVISLITLFGGLALAQEGIIRTPNPGLTLETGSFLDWLIIGLIWLLVAGIVIAALHLLIQGLNSSLEKERSLSNALAIDREQINRRTRELDRRLLQIRTAAEVSRNLSGLLDTHTLLQRVVVLIQSRFGLYYVGVFLLDARGETAILRAGTGEAGAAMIDAGFKLPLGEASSIGRAIANRKPRILLDIGRDAVHFDNPLLPLTRSEMVIPLISGDQVFGALTIQSSHPEAFDHDDMIVLQGIGDSVATALQNAYLFEQTQQNLQEITALNRQYVMTAWKKLSAMPELAEVVYENETYAGKDDHLSTQGFPLSLRGQVIGQLDLQTDRNGLNSDERTFIQEVINQAALAMENIRLLEESQRKAGQEQLLNQVVQNVRALTDMDSILKSTVGELGKALGATDGLIYLKPASGGLNQAQTSPETTRDAGSPDGEEQETIP